MFQRIPLKGVSGNFEQTLDQNSVFQASPFLRVVDSGGISVFISHGLVAVLLVAGSLASWMNWQFSLRTLLIAMTLVAVGLGRIIYAIRN